MAFKRIPYLLISVMLVAITMVVGFTIWILYQVGLDQQRQRLSEVVESRAHMIEALANLSDGARDGNRLADQQTRALEHLRDAHMRFKGFGQSGEFTLATLKDGQITFLLSHRHDTNDIPKSVPFAAKLAEPMRLALRGETGTVVAQDYRGEIVQAAYRPITELGWGIVAKIDMAEIRAPYLAAAGSAVIAAVIVVGFGSSLLLLILRRIIERARDGERYNRMLFERSPIGLALCRMDGTLVDVNPAFAAIVGYSVKELKQLTYWELTPEKYMEQERELLATLVTDKHYGPYEKEYIHRSGALIPVRLSGQIIEKDGEQHVWSSIEDVTDEWRADEAQRLAATVFNHTDEGIMITDANEQIIRINRAFTEITGYSEEDVMGMTPRLLSSGQHDKSFFERVWQCVGQKGSWRGEVWDARKGGEVFPVWQHISEVRGADGEIVNYVAVFSDISELKRNEEELSRLAHYDELTKLPNRFLFKANLEKVLHSANRGGHSAAVIFLDLDDFKAINDTLGHDAGDELLRVVAERLQGSVRGEDTVARMGGDEFTIILAKIESLQSAAIVVAKLIDAVSKPLSLCGTIVTPSTSVGVSLYPDDARSPSGLLKAADIAMYSAKRGGKNDFSFYAYEGVKQVEGDSC